MEDKRDSITKSELIEKISAKIPQLGSKDVELSVKSLIEKIIETLASGERTEVRGFGRQKGHTELYRGAEYVVDFLPKTKVEIAVDDSLMDLAIETISQAAKTDKVGDGKIFVTTLDEVVRIRTGETGASAV